MQSDVAAQIASSYDALERAVASHASTSALAAAYAEVGKLLLAAEDGAAAEPFLVRASRLTPDDARWPYLLGHLHRGTGDYAHAVTDFENAVRLQPDNEAARVWLGNTLLDTGQTDRAAGVFADALSRHADSVAALAGQGRAALARKEYRAAAEQLESALQRRPDASALRYPLAMAYRGLGRIADAEAQLAQRGAGELTPPDPAMRELATLLKGTDAYELRGDRALEEGNYTAAATFFREGVRSSPVNARLHQKLGTTLYVTGERSAARDELAEAIRLDPASAPAHYSLGVLMAEDTRTDLAVKALTTAVGLDASYVEARVALADVLRRSGRTDESIAQYRVAIRDRPGDARTQFGLGVALARANRFVEARTVLAAAVDAHPDRPELAHALARVLAASPDPMARDGARATQIVEALARTSPTIDVAETMAMALAEVGRYSEAVAMQKEAIKAARAMGAAALAEKLQPNLARYLARQPCRRPWRDDDPI